MQQIDNPNNDLQSRTGYSNLNPTKFTHKGDKQVTLFWKTTNCTPDFPCGPFANWQYLFSTAFYPSQALAGLDFNKINGTDPTPTLAQFRDYVAAGKIHYFLAGGRGGFGSSSSSSAITTWVESHFTARTVGGITVYDLTKG